MRTITLVLFISVALAGAAGAQPARELLRFAPAPSVEVAGKLADGQRAMDLVDGDARSGCMFSSLQGAVVTLRFAVPTSIGSLALTQAGWSNWAHPKRLRVTCDDAAPLEVTLDSAADDWGAGTTGRVQAIPIGRKVVSVRVEVLEVYSVGFPWGSPGELGIAAYRPARCEFGADPPCADPRLQALEATVSRTPAGSVELRLADADGNEYATTIADVPAQPRRVTVPLTRFAPAAQAFRALDPYRLTTLSAASGDRDAWTTLAATPTNRPGPEPGWPALPPVARRTKMIDGKKYTEGLSATSVGRFGNSLVNGLLTETVEGLRFRVGTPRAPGHEWDAETFELRLPGATGEPKVQCAPSYIAAVLRYRYPGGASVTERLSAAVPGFLFETDQKQLTLASTGAGSLPRRSGQPNEPEAAWALRAGDAKTGSPGALLVPDAGGGVRVEEKMERAVSLAEPWCVAIFGRANQGATLSGDKAVAVLLTFERPVRLQWQAAGLTISGDGPVGTVGFSSAFTGLLGDDWKPEAIAARARTLARLLHTFPDACSEWYRVSGNAVDVVNEFSYYRWGARAWQADDYAPVPPLYAAGPKPLVTGTDTGARAPAGIATRFGPFATRPGNTLAYRLPLLPFEHAAFPQTGADPELAEALRTSVAALVASPPIKPTWHAWSACLYDGWPSALLAEQLYPEETTTKLLTRARSGIELTFHPRVWMRRAELYSGRPYVGTGWFDRSAKPPMLGDPNSAAGSALYSLYLYALYSGDETTVRRLWPAARDVTRFFEVVCDWAAPQTSAREAANYSGIDMDTIAHLGLGGYWWLAQKIGTAEEAEHAAYLYAKIAPVAAMRFRFPRVLDPANREPGLCCDGFNEEGPTLRILADDMVIKDSVAMCLSWCGQQPEMYRFLMDFLGAEECRSFQADLLERYLPKWREMGWNKTRVASHLAQRAWLPNWPADDLRVDLPTFTKLMGTPQAETAGLVALLQGRNGPTLVDWWPKRLVRLDWAGKEGELRATLDGERATTLTFRWPARTAAVSVNGAAVAAERITPDRPVWRVKLPPGVVQVRISRAR